MPQTFQVLRCYCCNTFQVHQVKKVNKWNCKLCGEKQTIKKVFGQGSGADCRKHVQKLNMMRCETQQMAEDYAAQQWHGQQEENDYEPEIPQNPERTSSSSKWEMFLDVDTSETPGVDEDNGAGGFGNFTTDRSEFVAARKEFSKAKRERYQAYRQKPKFQASNFQAKGHHSDYVQRYDAASSMNPPQDFPSSYDTSANHQHNIFSAENASTYSHQPDPPKPERNNPVVFNQRVTQKATEATSIRKNKAIPKQSAVSKSSKWAKFVEEKSDESDQDENPGPLCDSPSSGFMGLSREKPELIHLPFSDNSQCDTTSVETEVNSHKLQNSMPNFSLGDDLEDLI